MKPPLEPKPANLNLFLSRPKWGHMCGFLLSAESQSPWRSYNLLRGSGKNMTTFPEGRRLWGPDVPSLGAAQSPVLQVPKLAPGK